MIRRVALLACVTCLGCATAVGIAPSRRYGNWAWVSSVTGSGLTAPEVKKQVSGCSDPNIDREMDELLRNQNPDCRVSSTTRGKTAIVEGVCGTASQGATLRFSVTPTPTGFERVREMEFRWPGGQRSPVKQTEVWTWLGQCTDPTHAEFEMPR